MKKRMLALILFSIILFLSSVIASSLTGNLERGSQGISEIFVSAFGPFFEALLGGEEALMFEKILIFFIITSIIYMVIQKMEIFKDNKAIILIVTLSASLLATRFTMGSELLTTILLPYNVLGITLSAFLPIIVGFFFIHQFKYGFLRKSFWVLFVVVFFAMWDLWYFEAGNLSWMYFWSAVIAFLLFLFDGTIRRTMIKEQMKAAKIESVESFAMKIHEQLGKLEESRKNGYITEEQYRKTKKRLGKQLDNLLKY